MKWKNVKLIDLCEVFEDGNWIESKDQSKSGIRLIQTGNIKLGTFANRINKSRYISKTTFEKLRCREIFTGDILVSRLPDPVGRACIIPKLSERAITAVDCTIIRLKKDCLPQYLNYVLQSSRYFTDIHKKVSGATRQRISRKNLGEILIPLPSIEEQKKIISKINFAFTEIDKAIVMKESNMDRIKQLKKSILNNLLKNNSLNFKIGEICTLAYGKGLPKDKRVRENGIPAYGANGIKCYAAEPLYNRPSIIIGRKGSAGELQWVENPFWALDVTYYVLPNEKKVNLRFLYYLLQMLNLPKLAKGVKPGINRNEVYNIDVKLPSIEDQIKITERLEEILILQKNLLELNEKTNADYNSLKLAIINEEIKNIAA